MVLLQWCSHPPFSLLHSSTSANHKHTHVSLANQEELGTLGLAGAAPVGGVSVGRRAESHSHFPLNVNHQRRECGSVLRLTLCGFDESRLNTGYTHTSTCYTVAKVFWMVVNMLLGCSDWLPRQWLPNLLLCRLVRSSNLLLSSC